MSAAKRIIVHNGKQNMSHFLQSKLKVILNAHSVGLPGNSSSLMICGEVFTPPWDMHTYTRSGCATQRSKTECSCMVRCRQIVLLLPSGDW